MNVRLASILGVVASVTSAIGLFLVFRVSMDFLGAATVGSWVIIQSAFFVSRIAEGGVGINLTRIHAVDRGDSEKLSPLSYYLAGLILVVAPVTVIGLLLVWPVQMLLLHYFHTHIQAVVIHQLVLLSYLIAVLNAFGTVGMATVEGMGKLAWRHAGTITSNVVFLVGAYPLIHEFGVVGLSLLYVLAAGVVVTLSCAILWWTCRFKHSPQSIWVIVRRIWRESMSATGMGLVRMTFEPWTKFLVGTVGSLAAVAALDLAFRVTTQVRVLIQSAIQPLLFIGARSEMSMSESAFGTYTKANSLVVQANWGALALLSCLSPVISFLGFGHFSALVVCFILILAVGNSINSMGVIGYYAEASRGGMDRLLHIHLVMMAINVGLGILGGWAFGPVGAVLAYALGFTYGGLVLLQTWADASSVRLADLILSDRWIVVIALLAFIAAVGTTFVRVHSDYVFVSSLGLTAITCLSLMPFYFKRWRNLILR